MFIVNKFDMHVHVDNNENLEILDTKVDVHSIDFCKSGPQTMHQSIFVRKSKYAFAKYFAYKIECLFNTYFVKYHVNVY